MKIVEKNSLKVRYNPAALKNIYTWGWGEIGEHHENLEHRNN